MSVEAVCFCIQLFALTISLWSFFNALFHRCAILCAFNVLIIILGLSNLWRLRGAW